MSFLHCQPLNLSNMCYFSDIVNAIMLLRCNLLLKSHSSVITHFHAEKEKRICRILDGFFFFPGVLYCLVSSHLM